MTKKNSGMLWSYYHSHIFDIYEAYENPSRNKVSAFDDCVADEIAHHGYDGRITGASCHFFSYAFRYVGKNGEERLRYHTYANVYDFEIE